MMLLCEWVIPVWFGMDVGYKVEKQKIITFDKWLEMVSQMKGIKEEERKR